MITFILIKTKLYFLISFFSAICLGSAILGNVAYGQISPNTQNTSTASTPSPPSTLQQPTAPSKLHLVKITSPTKGQQIPAGSNLTIAGTAIDNGTTSPDCKVSVIVNGIWPYQQVVPTGHGGANDYSTWNYMLTPTYSAIKDGQNKITAKFSCSNNPSLTSHNSVNVTGVVTSVAAVTNDSNVSSTQQQMSSIATSSPNTTVPLASSTTTDNATTANLVPSDTTSSTTLDNNSPKALSVSVHLDKNSVHPGDIQTVTIRVTDKNSANAVPGASVSGRITAPSGILKKLEGTTDDKGKASYSWKVSNEYTSGKYEVKIGVSSLGYAKYSTSKTFKVTPSSYNLIPSYHSTIIRAYPYNTDTNTNNYHYYNPHSTILPNH
jgi:hypothetical protein